MMFLYAVNNRLTDASFSAGLISNIVTQISTVAGYYYGMQNTSGSIASVLLTLYMKSTLIITYNDLYSYLIAGDFQSFGTGLIQFITSLVNYKSPNVNTGRDTI